MERFHPARYEIVSRVSRFCLAAVAGIVLASEARADIDYTGRWRLSDGTFADVVQTGSNVTVTWTDGATPLSLSGTCSQNGLSASAPQTILELSQYGDGAILDGILGLNSNPNVSHRRFTRCECYDGNSNDGDGCSAECRVEPCFECTPEPSVCTPSADVSPCDDENDCTTGETCSGGTCGNGSAVAPCVDLTGSWQLVTETDEWEDRSERTASYTQRDGIVFSDSQIGTVNPATGALTLVGRGGYYFCNTSTVVGTATLDNLELDVTGSSFLPAGGHCLVFPNTTHGRRCDAVAGCGLTDCTGFADGTPCDDGETCTVSDACSNALCGGRPKCFPCLACDSGNGSCDEAPRTDCTGTQKPSSSHFKLSTNKSKLAWGWGSGDAFDAEDLDPLGPNDLTLCVFGGGSRVYQTTLSSGAACSKPPCWKGGDGAYKYRNDEDNTPIVAIGLREGVDGKSKIQLKAKGPLLGYYPFYPLALPAIPLTMPVVTQLQSSTGACFGAEFAAGGTKLNADGEFKAVGGTLP